MKRQKLKKKPHASWTTLLLAILFPVIVQVLSSNTRGEMSTPEKALPKFWSRNKPAVLATMLGGLGNRLFTLAAAYAYCIDNKLSDPLGFQIQKFRDHSEWGGHPLEMKHANFPRTLNGLFPKIDIQDFESYPNKVHRLDPPPYGPIHEFADIHGINTDYIVFDGYWFSEEYFKKHRESILAYLRPHKYVVDVIKKEYNDMKEDYYTIGMHLRLGHHADSFHFDRITPSFVESSLRTIQSYFPLKKKDMRVIIVTDNESKAINFATIAQKLNISLIFYKAELYSELLMMSFCDSLIMSDSTFSWWAAYLGNISRPVFYDKKYERRAVKAMLQSWIAI